MGLINDYFIQFLDFSGNLIHSLYEFFAKFVNYPSNPGMPLVRPNNIINYFDRSPYPQFVVPKIDKFPTSFFETIVGGERHLFRITKLAYPDKLEGFYNYYIDAYSNLTFLPDWLSEWLQLNWNIYLDTTRLENIQEIIFLLLITYMKIVNFRISLYWFLTINPYVRPWIYLTSIVDWTYDITAGLTPGLMGIDVGLVIYLLLIGKLTDMVNCLVFTMPFLPSEGQVSLMRDPVREQYVNDKLHERVGEEVQQKVEVFKQVIAFKSFPTLWSTHPIPNELREYWFFQRPDILKYMIETYQNLGVNFYPDEVLKYAYDHNITELDIDNLQNLLNHHMNSN